MDERSDRELLELAARAAGAEYEWDEDHVELVTPIGGATGYWNPLTDDGDALRLAVKLRLEIAPLQDGCVEVRQWFDGRERCCILEGSGDHAADTRRAIVRAAASIGAAMKEGKE
jgi:hypothetical protein